MDESWNHLQNLEAHIKEHNTQIEKLTPLRTRHHSRQSSVVEELTKRGGESSAQAKMLSMAKEIKEKEREIMYLKTEIATLKIYKEQSANMQTQIKLLREKSVICEREAQNKSSALSNLENNTVPKVEKLEIELKEAIATNDKLQKAYYQCKKDAEERQSALTNLKQSYSGQEGTVKSLEEDKRSLKAKLGEVQGKFDDIFKQHEKNIEHLKNKDQLTLALEEDNERLRTQIENTMESLQKCQYELSLLPKLKQEIHQREQLISAASRELEKEKTLKNKVKEEKEKCENQLASIFEFTEGDNPIEYIQKLKVLLNKSTKDHSNINEEIQHIKERQRYSDSEKNKLIDYLANYIKAVCKELTGDNFVSEVLNLPELDESARPLLQILCETLQKLQIYVMEKNIEFQENNEFLSQRVAKLETNMIVKQRIDEMENLIQQQEVLSEQLTTENTKIKKQLEACHEELLQSEIEKQEIAEQFMLIQDHKKYTEDQINKLQETVSNLCKDHEKALDKLKNKEELCNELTENNEKLRAQLEEIIKSLNS